MKIKKLNIIMFLFLLLVMVGFSPPFGNSNINNSQATVYAEEKTYYDADFVSAIKSYINKYELFTKNTALGDTLVTNLDSSIGRFNKYLDMIVDSTETLMVSLCVLTIAIIGWKYMNNGSGNLIDFIKSKEKLYNTALAMIFVLGIPTLVHAIDGISVKIYDTAPKTRTTDEQLNDGQYILALDTEEGSVKISNIFVTPASYLRDIYTDSFFESQIEFQGNFATGDEDSDARFLSTGGFLRMIEKFLLFLLKFIYTPFHFIINIIGIIGFYPMSFDPELYNNSVVDLVVKQMNGFAENDLVQTMFKESTDITAEIVSTVAEAFQSVIIIINLIAGVLKKICLAAVDFACYFFGIKVLLGVETTKVKDFLYRLAQGVLGMFAAPLIVQTLIDVDAIISAAILGLAGNALPGVGMMNLIMKPSEASYSLLNFVFASAMLAMMVFIVQAFFFRRIELIMYYLAAPAVFLKHIFEPRPKIVMLWLGQVASASFVTTTYAPLFVTVNFLIKFGGALDGLKLLLYYAIIWFIIYKGKDVTLWLTDLFFGGGSFSDTMMRTKMQEGLEYTKNLPGNLATSGIKVAGKTHGMIDSFRGAYSAEKENGNGMGTLLAKTAMGAILSDKLRAGTEAYAQSYSSATDNSWYNNHLKNKEASYNALEKAKLTGSKAENVQENAHQMATRQQTLKDKKTDDKNYNDAYKEVAKENPNLDRNSDEFKESVQNRYEDKGINNKDKANYAKGQTVLKQMFEDADDEYLNLSENSLINETVKSEFIKKLAISENINIADKATYDEFKKNFRNTDTGKHLATIEKASADYKSALDFYNEEKAKPLTEQDTSKMLDALRTIDKSKDIIGQSNDVEKMLSAQISTNNAENKLKQVESEIKKESDNIARTITEITKIESQMSQMKPTDAGYDKLTEKLSKLQSEKSTYETTRSMNINTRSNLENKISASKDTVRQQEIVVKTKADSIDRTYKNPSNRSASENAYREEVGKHTYAKVRVETSYEKVTDSNGNSMKDSNGQVITREIKIKRDSSGNAITDSSGNKIDYSSGENYNKHMKDIKTLNEGVSQVKAQANYESNYKSDNNSNSGGKPNTIDKVFSQTMREHRLKGNFHNHDQNGDNPPF